MKPPEVLRCSFCNATEVEALKLIAGPGGIFICDECVRVCTGIIANEPNPTAHAVEPRAKPTVPQTGRILTCSLCGMPMPWEEALLIPERGVLCPGCSGEVETAAAQKQDDGQ